MKKVEKESFNILDANIEKLKELFPEALTDGKINFETLKKLLGEYVDNEDEKYEFTWNGKQDALKISQLTSTNTLLPCKEKSVDWDNTQNIYIEGDNLEVLKILQKSYNRKVKMIYIDPPYNTGSDFVYKDNFKDNIKNYKKQTNQEHRANAETSGRFHTDWLNMMYPRLRLAKNLLTDDGVLCISIDDNELEQLKKICGEIFGNRNFVCTFIWRKIYGIKNDVKQFSLCHDYILVYAKNIESFKPNLLPRTDEANARYKNPDNDPRGIWKSGDFTGAGTSTTSYEIVSPSGKKFLPPDGKHWIASYENYLKLREDNRLWFGSNGDSMPSIKRFLSEVKDGMAQSTFLDYTEVGHSDEANRELNALLGGKYFDYPKPVRLIYRLLYLTTDKDSIILDFFSGSATTAHSTMKLNLENDSNVKYILVQLPELCDAKSDAYKAGYRTICDIGEDRIRKAGAKLKEDNGKFATNLDVGFKVFQLDSSNIKQWNSEELNKDNASEYFQTHINPIVEGRTTEDLLYEIILKEGLPLSAKIEPIDIYGKTVYSVEMGYKIICFENEITIDLVQAIGEMKPRTIVFKDSGFKDENIKMNVIQELKKYGIEEENIKSI